MNENPQVKEAYVAPITEAISDVDKLQLEIAKMNRRLAAANAEKVVVQNELAELSHKYMLLQIHLKYGINLQSDVLDENGNILRGALVKQDYLQGTKQEV